MSRWPTTNQKMTTFKLMGYHPNPRQARIHLSEAEVLQVVGAEGGGKSYVTAAEIAANIPWCDLVYVVGQTYDNTHREFEYLVEGLPKLGAVEDKRISQPKHGSWRLTTRTGCRVITLSVDRGARAVIAKGEQPDLIVLTEAGVISSYGVLLASVRRVTRSGGRVLLSGTLNDDFGWYATLTDELAVPDNVWRGETYSLPAWSNLYLYPGGRSDPEIKRLEAILTEEEFARTVAAERRPSQALVFGEFSYTIHVRDCSYDPQRPVYLWIDPGYYPSAYAVLAAQLYGDEVWQVDEVYLHHHTHQEVIAECKTREWWGNVQRAVMDIAGRQHRADAKRSAVEVWANEAGLRPYSQPIKVLDGVSRHKTFLNPMNPRLFHDPSCVNTLAEYRKYKKPTDKDGNVTHDMPVDEHNHAMKAIAYGLVDRFGFVDNRLSEAAVIPRRDIINEIDGGEW